MARIYGFLLAYVFTFSGLSATGQFDSLFFNKSLRFDYYHAGNAGGAFISFDEMREEPFWGGSHTQLIDSTGYGQYLCTLTDATSGRLLYSRGYSTLFSEWQTTDEAKNTMRSFSESVVVPFPRRDAIIQLYSRNRQGLFELKFSHNIILSDYNINREKRTSYPVFNAHLAGPSETCLDIVLLPEGYTAEEMALFESDCKKFSDELFSYAPYNEYKNKINIRGILAPSPESGSDIPARGIWKNTLLNSRFFTFGLDRYCMTHDFKTVRDVAANAPYDQIYILVNTKEYGGGAIFNHYALSVNSNAQAGKIFIHEFGHSFAGLADEYFNSAVAYNDFYPLDVEPWEPNITTLVNFDSKWKSLMEKATPIPTPTSVPYIDHTGVFEGGGYAAKGIYRPAYDCLMNTFSGSAFCPVCSHAIRKMLDLYTR